MRFNKIKKLLNLIESYSYNSFEGNFLKIEDIKVSPMSNLSKQNNYVVYSKKELDLGKLSSLLKSEDAVKFIKGQKNDIKRNSLHNIIDRGKTEIGHAYQISLGYPIDKISMANFLHKRFFL